MRTLVNVVFGLAFVAIGTALAWMLFSATAPTVENKERSIDPAVVLVESEGISIRTYTHEGCDVWVLKSGPSVSLAHSPNCPRHAVPSTRP